MIPLIDLRAQYLELKHEIMKVTEQVFDSGVYISGPEVQAFEKEMEEFTDARHAVSTANGTDALVLALEACGIGVGDEVITTPYTFFATAEAISRVGATPVFADIDPRTYNLCPKETEKKITIKTKAIIPVHIFGQPADMDAFHELAHNYNLHIIEDACQALGARYKGKPVGALGTVGCVSFFPTKNLGAYGDGGMVITNDDSIADKVRLLSLHGSNRRYYHDIIGYNSRLDSLQAAILRVKLRKLQEWNTLRQQKAAYYVQHLKGVVGLPFISPEVSHVFHLFIVESSKRMQLASRLKQVGISTGHYYPCPLHLQNAFASLGYKPGDLPVSETLCERALALPMHAHLTMKDQTYIVEKVFEIAKP
ncbi:DegT/DnrJ/EryC1/StrS family aminotransferase [Paenibacillus silviterrae]|uniref:DegT/DnrJ/EryC1/StrS family aminotransferase n=1 Tax=Paenibacillus silviterrae TaxID=3242194 RepID=UPI00254340CF|nr:DegT/DnrJ/EryC1/StrS family aminotransferase [Paenibacillus chinjuensis]